MDPLFYFEAEKFLDSSFMLFWAGSLGCMLLIACLDKRHPKLARRLVPIFMICVALVILSVHFVAGTTNSILRKEFDSAAAGQVTAIHFHTSGGEVVVNDQGRIQEFLKLLRDPEGISAHHSHPEKEVRFTLSDSAEVYSLGKDSAVQDEYWLHLQSSKKYSVQQRRMKQFRSRALGVWLEENIAAKKRPAARG